MAVFGYDNTGYEQRFDFPARDVPPARIYMFASVPRSGSTVISHQLWQTGCLGAPLEYLNFEPGSPYGFASNAPERQAALWAAALRRRTSPNGIFGFKFFLGQREQLAQRNPALLAQVRPNRIVYLTRADRDAHIISYARAITSGVWRKEQEDGVREHVAFSRQAMETAENSIDVQSASWEALFQRSRAEPMRLTFEDALADPKGTAERVARFLGVAVDPRAAVRVPTIEKQTRVREPDWIDRYRSGPA